MPKQIKECKECERGNILGNALRCQERNSEDVHLSSLLLQSCYKIYEDGYKDVYGILRVNIWAL